MKELLRLYNEYAEVEFESEPITEIPEDGLLGLCYTEDEENDIDWLQVNYNVNTQETVLTWKYCGDDEERKFVEAQSIEDFKEELESITFQDYYSWALDKIEEQKEEENMEDERVLKEVITVYEKNGKVREVTERKAEAAAKDLASLLYCKLRGYKYTVKDHGYGRITVTSRDEFGKVTYEFENCDNIR